MIELIKELRARTHLGMMECKKALEESNGDMDKAILALQKKGLKKVDDLILSTEGIVKACVVNGYEYGHPFNDIGLIVEINCQTDFGARSEIFQNFVDKYLSKPVLTDEELQNRLTLISNQLGEKVVIHRKTSLEPEKDSVITVYNHLGGKIAVLMESELTLQNSSELPKDRAILDLLDNIAMQIAATKPLAVNRDSLPNDLVQKQISLYQEEVKSKPEQVRNKILEGKMTKWYSEVVLLEQNAVFLDDSAPKQSVQSQLDKLGVGLVKISRFLRYERGEVL